MRRSILLLTLLLLVLPAALAGQCFNPGTTKISDSWYPISSIAVNIDPAFDTPGATGLIRNVVNNWDNGITFQTCAAILWSTTTEQFPATGPGTLDIYYTTVNRLDDGTVARGVITLSYGVVNNRVSSGVIAINKYMTDPIAISQVVAHEIGHSFGLAHCALPGCPAGSSVMTTGATSLNQRIGLDGPTSCDLAAVVAVAWDYWCDPCGGDPCCGDPCCGDACCQCERQGFFCDRGTCYASPIIVDVGGDGYQLTDAAHGVSFDLGLGGSNQIAWTAAGSNDAFLVLDRNSNGMIDDGGELFGNFTTQPRTTDRNGFAALAVLDEQNFGGNENGAIERHDRYFSRLRLWVDTNHNGVSEPNELFSLDQMGVESISLDFKEDQRKDQYGNIFRYRAKVDFAGTPQAHRWAYDVYLNTLTSASLNRPTTTQQATRTCRIVNKGKHGAVDSIIRTAAADALRNVKE